MKYLVTITLIIGLILTSCASDNSNNQNNVDTNVPSSNEDNETNGSDSDQGQEVSYEVVSFESLSDPLKNKVEYLKDQPGFEIFEADSGQVYLFIGAGMQPTGGYGLEVKSLMAKDNQLTADVEFIKPDPDDIVTQAITYPYIILELNQMYDAISVDSDINFSSYVYEIMEGSGTYVGQIDSTSIEVETSDGFMVLRSYYMDKLLQDLSENDSITFEYVILDTNQHGLIDIEKSE